MLGKGKPMGGSGRPIGGSAGNSETRGGLAAEPRGA
jgi:hypothetical protein